MCADVRRVCVRVPVRGHQRMCARVFGSSLAGLWRSYDDRDSVQQVQREEPGARSGGRASRAHDRWKTGSLGRLRERCVSVS